MENKRMGRVRTVKRQSAHENVRCTLSYVVLSHAIAVQLMADPSRVYVFDDVGFSRVHREMDMKPTVLTDKEMNKYFEDRHISTATTDHMGEGMTVKLTDMLEWDDGLISRIMWMEHEAVGDIDNGICLLKCGDGDYVYLHG